MSSINVLAIGPLYPATAAKYLIDALACGANRTIRCGPTYNDHYGIDWGGYQVHADIPLERDAPEWNIPELIDQCTRDFVAPDLIFLVDNYNANIITTDRIPIVMFSYDGWPNSFERYHMVKPKVAYTVHPYGVRPAPRIEPDPNWNFLPPACDPNVHIPLQDTKHRNYDFVLCATMYGKRPALCDYISQQGFSVIKGTVETDRYIRNYSSGKTTYHNCCYQEEIKYRFFEAAAMGCVNISDHTRLFEEVGAIPEVHYLPVPITETDDDPYPDFQDIANAVHRVVFDQGLYRSIARTAYEWVMKNHTYYHRAKTVYKDLGLHSIASSMYQYTDRTITPLN